MQSSPHSPSQLSQTSRRDFLKLLGANLAGLLLPSSLFHQNPAAAGWPKIELDELPTSVRNILRIAPRVSVRSNGLLTVKGYDHSPVQLTLAPTQWNQEHNKPYHRLSDERTWGIVLHWYGDKENFDHSIKGYLRGFDSLRRIDDEQVQTSAHFLIGSESPLDRNGQINNGISIIQTQAPDRDGTPFLASHLRPLDYEAHRAKRQYFVRAYYQLASQDAAIHSLLQEFFDGPRQDPNQRTIAIEIAGFNFDQPENYPGDQKIANILALVWAIMRRYQIPASNILGHHEIQLGKADPGKKLMATIRFLLGVKAILEADPTMIALVFGQFLERDWDRKQAIDRYFNFVHQYATLVGSRRSIYEWEILSQFWPVIHTIDPNRKIQFTKILRPPLMAAGSLDGNVFLAPQNHEGVDLYIRHKGSSTSPPPAYTVQLIGDGECLYQGQSSHCGQGNSSIFRHYGADGSVILSIYEQIGESTALLPGKYYRAGYPIGKLLARNAYQPPYLHFAIAYGTCWDMDLQATGQPPLNAGHGWISERYLEPVEYLAKQFQ